MIGFTLGNISVEGTYTTHALNLTPRGVLAVAALLPLLLPLLPAVPYRIAIPAGSATLSATLSPIYILSAVFNILAAAVSFPASKLAYPRGQLSPALSFPQLLPALQLAASRQLAQLSASTAGIFSANLQKIVTIL